MTDIVERLRLAAEDPMWDAHAEVSKVTLATAAATITALREEVEGLYVPGEFRCKKCGFTLSQFTLDAHSGEVGSRDQPGEKCPNDGSPLWRVTWQERTTEHYERAVAEMIRADNAESALTALRQRVVEVVGPFARVVPYGIAADDEEVTLPIKARHFRAARALHDELTQETK